MEISAMEIDLLCKRIAVATKDYFVSGVYSIQGGLLLRLSHSTKQEKFVAISSFAAWLTTKNITLPEATKFVGDIRERVERTRLISARVVKNERIARFSFESRDNRKFDLYCEFFGKGNQILTEIDEEDNPSIIEVASAEHFRHRKLLSGEIYNLPPSRGRAFQEINQNTLLEIFREAKKSELDEKLTAIRWFGRNIGTSRKFVEEIFYRAKVEPSFLFIELTEIQVTKLGDVCSELISELEHSEHGFLLIPESLEGAVPYEVEIDVCPIVPVKWQNLAAKRVARIAEFPRLSDALDEAQVTVFLQDKRRKASEENRYKIAELQSAISKQSLLLEKNRSDAIDLRNLATDLLSGTREISEEVTQKLQTAKLISPDEESGHRLRFLNEPRSFLNSFNSKSLASRLFDEAKQLEQTNLKLEQIRTELQKQCDELESMTLAKEQRAQKNTTIERRPREWFERYRWFLSLDLRLVVGGRDATSNSVLLNKYLREKDLVFHADIHGSPFFLLRDGGVDSDLSDEVAMEVAQATVSFSRAWKDELGSADAYWVLPSQIKKSAPSGEYLPRGSFFIEGKKNFLRHLKVELSVGLLRFDELMRVTGHSPEKGETKFVVVVCGPEKSLSSYCISAVKIAPGKERASIISKRIKQELIRKIKDEKLKDESKHITIDEIIRVLPSGNFKLVSEKQNR